eukprot:Gb_17727 [translate_table: standard]
MGKSSRISKPKYGGGGGGECYYPGCRKDAQCNCGMCMESIHATMDLRPSNHPFSPVRTSNYMPIPANENQSWLCSQNKPSTPPRKETKRLQATYNTPQLRGLRLFENEPVGNAAVKKKKKNKGSWMITASIVVLFLLVMEFVVPWGLFYALKPSFSAVQVRGIAQDSMARKRLGDRLEFVGRKISRIVQGRTVNCTGSDSPWKLEHSLCNRRIYTHTHKHTYICNWVIAWQDGLLVRSRCIIYSSMAEEVSVWGCPTQTAGVIGRGMVDRSFTIMSGRVMEWQEGKMEYVVHKEGESWTYAKWAASVVQMDGRTWVLEYKTSSLVLQGGGLISIALELIKWGICRVFERVGLSFGSFLMPKLNFSHAHVGFRAPPT